MREWSEKRISFFFLFFFFKRKKMGKHNTRYHSSRSRQSSTDRHRLRTSHKNGTEPKSVDDPILASCVIPFVSSSIICYWNTKLPREIQFRFET